MSKPVPALSRGREPTRVRCITAPPPPRRKARRSRRQSERGALWHKSETRAICWSRPGFTCAGPHTSPPFASPFASYSRDGGRRTADELMHDRSSCEPRPMWVARECPTGNQLHRRSRACFGSMTSRSWCIAAAGCSNRDCRSSGSSEEQGSQRRGVASLRFAKSATRPGSARRRPARNAPAPVSMRAGDQRRGARGAVDQRIRSFADNAMRPLSS
jgi:hypothetical protein